MSYSIKIIREQGGSKLNLSAGASVQYHDEAVIQFPTMRMFFGAAPPTITAKAGDWFVRGGSGAASAAGLYINVSDGANGGSVWRRAASATGD